MAPMQEESRDATDEQGAPESLRCNLRASGGCHLRDPHPFLARSLACLSMRMLGMVSTHLPSALHLPPLRTNPNDIGLFHAMHKESPLLLELHLHAPFATLSSASVLPRNMKIEAVAPQGIMLCTLQEYASMIPRFYVCKPATRQWCRIPNPRTRYHTRKTAIVTCSSGGRRLEYKIVRFSEPKPSNDSKSAYDLRCEIFDSRSRAWRRSNDIRLPPYTFLRSYDAAVTANGAVHWLTYDDIFAFNVCNESWRLIPLPESARRDVKGWPPKRVLVKREGLLCLLLIDDEWLAIWVMTDYKEQIWERREVVSLEALNKDRTSIVFDLYSPSIALACSWSRVIWYGFFPS